MKKERTVTIERPFRKEINKFLSKNKMEYEVKKGTYTITVTDSGIEKELNSVISFIERREEAIEIAKDLRYPSSCCTAIIAAKTESEVDRALINARKAC